HAPDRRAVRAGGGGAPDRRPLHHEPEGGGEGARAARLEALRAVPLGYVPASARSPGAARRAGPRGRRRAHRAGGHGRALMAQDRWFGATGRRVPAIAVEGDPAVPLDQALVLDSVEDEAALREAHAAGRPVVVRAADPAAVKRALARPEVASVLVPDASLLGLDFTGVYD